jgi:hypothetical protein
MTASSDTQKRAATPMSRQRAQRQGNQPPAKTPPAIDLDAKFHEVSCNIKRSVRYHRAREQFYSFYAALITFTTLLAGSGVVIAILAALPPRFTLIAGAVVAVLQLIEVVAQLSYKARLHNSLASEFLALERIMARNPNQDQRLLADLEADILTIELREPPIKRYLDVLCHNQLAVSIGSTDIEYLLPHQRILANWLSGASALQHKNTRLGAQQPG